MKKTFEISWRDEVHRSVEIEAETKEKAFNVWASGEWDAEKIMETDSVGLSDTKEIMESIEEVL